MDSVTPVTFDNECRAAKRLTRQYERTYAAASRRAASSTTVSSTAAAAASTAAAAKAAWYNQRRLYRQLRRRKCSEFWQRKLEASKADPRGLWQMADALLACGRTPASSAIDVEVFNQFFAEKIAKSDQIPATLRRPCTVAHGLACHSDVSHR